METFRTLEKILTHKGREHNLLVRDALLVSTTNAHKPQLHLYSKKEVSVGTRVQQKTYIAGIVANKGYTSLYVMGIYAFPERFTFSPELRKKQKGKSCFHIRSLDSSLLREIERLIEHNILLFKAEDWI